MLAMKVVQAVRRPVTVVLECCAKSKRLFDCHCIHLDHSFDCDRLVGCLVCRAARDHELF